MLLMVYFYTHCIPFQPEYATSCLERTKEITPGGNACNDLVRCIPCNDDESILHLFHVIHHLSCRWRRSLSPLTINLPMKLIRFFCAPTNALRPVLCCCASASRCS